MPQTITLTKTQARHLMLASLGLLQKTRKKASKADLLTTIRRIHNLQIDTISVVARAHLHILWSRLGSYPTDWVDELHAEGHLFEYYAHAVSLLPIEDYPLFRALMLERFVGWNNIKEWGYQNAETLDEILSHIRTNGAVKSSDFKGEGSRGAWWDWKVEKVALEHLYYRGDLMIARRERFQRVYDLRERVLPDWDDDQTPSIEETERQLLLNAVKALGVASSDWAARYFYLKLTPSQHHLRQLAEEGVVIPVSIPELGKKPFYCHPENLDLLELAAEDKLDPTLTSILSPFDPLVSDRARARELFGFDYLIECYTPAPKRSYGYFTLPLLHKGKLIGRMDAKAWRKQKRLQVIKLHLEEGVRPSRTMASALAKTLTAYALWQGLNEIEVDWVTDEGFRELLRAELAARVSA